MCRRRTVVLNEGIGHGREQAGVEPHILSDSTIWTWMEEEAFKWKRKQSRFQKGNHDPQALLRDPGRTRGMSVLCRGLLERTWAPLCVGEVPQEQFVLGGLGIGRSQDILTISERAIYCKSRYSPLSIWRCPLSSKKHAR